MLKFSRYDKIKKHLLSNIEKDVIILENNRIERVLLKYAYALGRYELSEYISEQPKDMLAI